MVDDPDKSERIADISDDPTSSSVEISVEWNNEATSISLHEAIQDVRRQVDAGEATEQLSVRDARLVALIGGLEETGQLSDIAEVAGARLDRDSDDGSVTRAETLRLLIRIGLWEVAPEIVQTAVEANKEYLISQADEF